MLMNADEMEALNRWSVIECQIAIICACLPATRAMLVRVCPGIFGAESGHASSGQMNQYKTRTGTGRGTNAAGGRSHISKTVSYSVDYSGKSPRESANGFIQLSEVESHRS